MSNDEIRHLRAIIKLNEEHNLSQRNTIEELKHVLFFKRIFCYLLKKANRTVQCKIGEGFSRERKITRRKLLY